MCYTCQHPILLPADLSIDAMDVSGEQQFDVMHNIVKQRLSSDGSVVQEKKLESKQSGCMYVRTYVCMLVCPSTYPFVHACVCVHACVSLVSKCVL